MLKTELKGQGLNYWAKRSDEYAHICKSGHQEYGVLCERWAALLGNNYADNLSVVCPDCLKVYNDDIKTYIVDSNPPEPKAFILIDNDLGSEDEYDEELNKDFINQMKNLDTLKIGESYFTGGAANVEIKRIS